MYTILSMVSGFLNSITVMQNGDLSAFYGAYSGAVIIHLVGLVVVLCWYAAVRHTLPPKQKLPLWMYMGGVIGVGTVVLTTSAYGGVSVTAIGALCLLGQTLASIAVDQFGWFGAQKSPFFAGRCLALAAAAAGVVIMILPMGEGNLLAALMALASGVTIVFARVVNGQLALRNSPMRSTVMNYVTGLTTSAVLMLLIGRGEPMWTQGFTLSNNWFMYLGGAVGVGLITLLNITVPKVPSVLFTLLQFVGQILMGLLLDTLLTGVFSWRSLVGGLLVAVGLLLDMWMNRRRTARRAMENP
ncbi:MAG: DMT family transporter [Eubacteriales bacterium]|nr:DMT family transporter [Eubacteriales bacterium]